MNGRVTFEIRTPRITFDVLPTPVLEFTIQAAFVEGVGKDYTGPYEVTPQLYKDILLPTKGSMLKEDITVLKVPQYEVTNAAGGTTLILGGE